MSFIIEVLGWDLAICGSLFYSIVPPPFFLCFRLGCRQEQWTLLNNWIKSRLKGLKSLFILLAMFIALAYFVLEEQNAYFMEWIQSECKSWKYNFQKNFNRSILDGRTQPCCSSTLKLEERRTKLRLSNLWVPASSYVLTASCATTAIRWCDYTYY